MASGEVEATGWLSDRSKLALLLALVCAVWGGGWYLTNEFVRPQGGASETLAQLRGLFGDQFGAINALFSGLAFAGIIFSIVLQNRELSQTKSSLLEQTKATNRQRFDSTFFKLLQLHGEITRNLTDLQIIGRDAFKVLNTRIIAADADFKAYCGYRKLDRDQIRRIRDGKAIPNDLKALLLTEDVSNIESALESGVSSCENYLDDSVEMHEKKIRTAYTKVATEHLDNYSHYFRNLYHIFRFLDETKLIEDDEKPRYAKIVRSQLAEVELVALLYNSISAMRLPGRESMELGCPKMGRLLVRFDILQNLSDRSVIHPIHRRIFAINNVERPNGP